MDYSTAQETYQNLYEQLSALFYSFNLPRALVEDMFAIPSQEIRILGRDELTRYGLNQDDLVLEEQENARLRSECGPNGPTLERSLERDINARCAQLSGPAVSQCLREVIAEHEEFQACNVKVYGEPLQVD